MCKTTTPPRPAAQGAIRELPPNTGAGAVIPLEGYLQKYVTASAAALVPSTPPPLPPNVKSTHVAFSLLPLLANGPSPYYAGNFDPVSPHNRWDDEMHFSASLVKVAALFAAGQLHADAKAAPPGVNSLADFNSYLQTEINATADQRILNAHIGLIPQTALILNVTGFGSPGGPSVTFINSFRNSLNSMIGLGTNLGASVCITLLGYGYISTALIKEGFFDPSTTTGIWLAAPYPGGSIGSVRIPCVNDHPDAQITTTRQMCTLFSKIRLNQVPKNDLDANTTMQSLLSEPKPVGPDGLRDVPWLSSSRNPGVAPLFTVLADKVGVAGLGTSETPQVYSEGLIIKWNNPSKPTQVESFNDNIDPGNAHPSTRLSGEIAVCWQNLLAELIPGGTTNKPMFDPIIDIINKSVSDFLDQGPL